MKKITLLLVSGFLILTYATAQTNVSGFISANTTWNLAGSPYIVVGNILVMQGVILTIDLGVVVKFNDSTAIQINGELDAVGTAANRITFTSNQPGPAAGDWGKLQFTNLSNGAVFDINGNYVSGNIMKYCDVLYGGGLGYGVIHIYNSSLCVSNCRVNYSDADGIECTGFVKVDSSSFRNCTGSGLSISIIASSYCNYTIQYDTLEYNAGGGINGGIYFSGCPNGVITVKRNYFSHNSYWGGLKLSGSLKFIISENKFLNDSSQYEGGAINLSGGGVTNLIYENEFQNNWTQSQGGAILVSGTSATISCNKFFYNRANQGSAIYLDKTQNDTIRNNTFYGNKGNAVFFDMCTYSTEVIADNYWAHDTSLSGPTLYLRGFASGNNVSRFYVYGNEFTNNVANSEIFLYLNSNNSALDFAHISRNNFLSANTQYAVKNNVAFSGPVIDADSNYWNSTSTQQVDAAIYDFFDNANLSVVYYSPILTAPIVIDTTCTNGKPTGAESDIDTKAVYSTFFPNPITTTATISFGKEVHSATFTLYNLLGEKVAEVTGITGESFLFNRGNLRSGIYVFEVREGKSIWRGKAVVY